MDKINATVFTAECALTEMQKFACQLMLLMFPVTVFRQNVFNQKLCQLLFRARSGEDNI